MLRRSVGVLSAGSRRNGGLNMIALIGRNIGQHGALAQLQCADVSNYAPAIIRGHPRSVARHRSIAIRNHVEEVSNRRILQSRDVIRRGLAESASNNLTITIANAAMTRRAINIEPLLAALKIVTSDGKRKCRCIGLTRFACVSDSIQSQVPTSDGAFNLGPRRSMIREKLAFGKRLIFRLIMHVLPAADGHKGKTD